MAVPALIPVAAPAVPMVATEGDALLQVPPTVPSARVVADPVQTVRVPDIIAGSGLMVATLVAKQPLGNV